MFECVPNISEGRDRGVIDSIANAVAATPGVHLLHLHADPDHNRSVLTYVAEEPEPIATATLALYEQALRRIDLRKHTGEHPRIGAVDVTPFIPLAGTTMQECVTLAESVGQEVASRFDLPVYLYEHAARQEYRRELPKIRAGGFAGLSEKLRDPRWTPDFGPSRVHPSAGASVIGARIVLIAFNVQLRRDRFEVARAIARKVRASSGGLPFVRAIPIHLTHRGIVQVSMNLLDYRQTSLKQAFDAVREEASLHGVEILSSEIVGMVPESALFEGSREYLQLENLSPEIILEHRIAELR